MTSAAQDDVNKTSHVVANNGSCDSSYGNVVSASDTAGELEAPAPPAASTAPVTPFLHVFLPTYKILIVGDCGVGKSSLLSRFTRNRFDIQAPSTIGVEFTSRELEVPSVRVGEKERVIVQLWDTAGQERCAAISSAFFRNAVGAVFVYDVTREETLLRLPMWSAYVRQCACEDCVCIALGNKTDLRHLQTVSTDTAEDVAHRLGMRHFTASALDGNGVTHAFMQLVLSMNAVQQAKRLAAARQEEETTAAASHRSPAGPAVSSSLSPGRMQSGTLWSTPLSSATASCATPLRAPMRGQRMDLRGFGGARSQGKKTTKSSTRSCCM